MKKAMKKFIALVTPLLVIAMLMHTMLFTAFADTNIRVTVDGEEITFGTQQPVIINGRTLVPARGVFERLGFEPTWDGETNTATLTRHDYTVVITIGSDVFTTNGTEHTLEVYAQTINGSTMLPLRAVLESVGYAVAWDDATDTVLITTPAPPAPPSRSSLIGVWDWLNSTYYVFAADGTGTMSFADINWRTESNVLFVSENNQAPNEWIFSIEGDTLTLTSRLASVLSFTYTFQGIETARGQDSNLVGSWNNTFVTVAVFEDNGAGTFSGDEIRWWTRNGILSICNTPDTCETNCVFPREWYYTIDGNRLILRSRLVDDVATMLIR